MEIVKKVKKFVKKLMMKKGWKTTRHIIVFESDDWGAVRNSNKQNFEKLKSLYPNVKFDHYQSLDTLETDEDVELLANVLKKHKDNKNRPAKFTLNFATANPNFDETKKCNYQNIVLENITDSYQQSTNSKNIVNIVKKNQDVFLPQLHSREHFNSQFLLDDLKSNELVKSAFDLNIVGVASDNYCALDTLNALDNHQLLIEAQANFEQIFGYKSKTFISPCYVWSPKDEEALQQLGIIGLQGKIFQNKPIRRDKYKRVFHKFGSRSEHNLIYTARNCFFEPARETSLNIDDEKIIDNILSEIEFAFACNKPAIICTHRVNYASNMSIENREHNLNLLDQLLTSLEGKYSDLEYMFSTELVDIIKETYEKNKTDL